MPFGRTARFVRTYSYLTGRCCSTAPERAEALRQIAERTRLWNRLVALERDYREQRKQLLDAVCPGWHQKRGAARREAIAAAGIDDRLQVLEEERRQRVKEALTASTLYWPTKDAVRVEFEQARRKSGGPRFHGDFDEGTLVVRWQNGLAMHDLWSGRDNRARLWAQDPAMQGADGLLPAAYDPAVGSSQRARRQRVHSLFRVASDEGGGPVWLKLDLRLHRPLPREGLLRQVLLRRTHWPGGQERWQVSFVVECDPPEPHAPEEHVPETAPAAVREQAAQAPRERVRVAVDIGWRPLEDGAVRVAVWQSEDGRSGEVVLPADCKPLRFKWKAAPPSWCGDVDDRGRRLVVSRSNYSLVRMLKQVEDLQKAIDLRVNELRERLVPVMAGMDLGAPGVPAWWANWMTTLPRWRSARQIGRNLARWRERRFAGDEAAFAVVQDWWRRHARHLLDWQRAQWWHLRQRRLEIFRRAAARIVDMARVVILEDFDLSTFAEEAVGEPSYQEKVRRIAKVAAPGEFRLCLEHAARHRGGVEVVRIPPHHSTMLCPKCFHVNRSDEFEKRRIRSITVRCEVCGEVYDQDHAAAENLLRMWASQTSLVSAQE